ncbi:MAG: Retaining alpha-galactosidase, partial [Calditrichaeota bacterium]
TAGPLDYEGGPMLNAQQGDFRAIFNKPMSQGTRIHELALYVIFESPQQYLAGNPSDYMREPEFTQFLVDIPTTWDEIVALEGRVGDYLLLARRHDRDWYLAAITDWTARQMKVSLNFLTQGQWQAEIYCDGINADRYASDYAVHRRMVQREDTLMLELAPAGGWVARLSPQP